MKFKVGDRVRAVKLSYPPGRFPELTVGQLYTVEEVIGDKGLSIIIAERIDFGTRWENYKNAREFDNNNFELVEEVIPEPEFQIGDIVEAFGEQGVVFGRNNHDNVVVKFRDSYSLEFKADGRIYKWTKEPALKLIKRPIKEITFETNVKQDPEAPEFVLLNADAFYYDKLLKPFLGKQVVVTVKIKE